jgi:hypothetical protein
MVLQEGLQTDCQVTRVISHCVGSDSWRSREANRLYTLHILFSIALLYLPTATVKELIRYVPINYNPQLCISTVCNATNYYFFSFTFTQHNMFRPCMAHLQVSESVKTATLHLFPLKLRTLQSIYYYKIN